jgi:hypothetical protein
MQPFPSMAEVTAQKKQKRFNEVLKKLENAERGCQNILLKIQRQTPEIFKGFTISKALFIHSNLFHKLFFIDFYF